MGRGLRLTEEEAQRLINRSTSQDPVQLPERQKYGNVRTGGRASKLEMQIAKTFDLMERNGHILGYIEQIPFRLKSGCVHRVDFGILLPGDRVVWVEAKGYDHPLGRVKRREIEAIYKIAINLACSLKDAVLYAFSERSQS